VPPDGLEFNWAVKVVEYAPPLVATTVTVSGWVTVTFTAGLLTQPCTSLTTIGYVPIERPVNSKPDGWFI
jgi:hypothetical protein